MENELILKKVLDDFETFLDATDVPRLNSQVCRDYRDHKQWSDDEKKELEARGQAPIIYNYISRKVNAIIGYEALGKSDPKAYPRTPMHEKDAEAITDAIRYVADNNDFDQISSEVLENEVVEGYGVAMVEVFVKKNDFEIKINKIDWDRFYFDPHSRRRDFKDARWMGIVTWMNKDEAINNFREKAKNIDLMFATSQDVSGSTFDDRPFWIDRQRERLMILQHYYLKDGKWYVCFVAGRHFLLEPVVCPYINDDGEPECPIEAQSAYINRDNERYGEVLGMLDPQDEVNHRRSKALHLLSVRQTYGNSTAIQDVQKAKEELARPNGHLDIITGEFGKDFGILPTGDFAQGQLAMFEDAKAHLDASSINPALTGHDDKSLSGRAIQARQQGGATELEYPLMSGHRSWKRRVYRQIWNRIKQYWTEERWIRVTDDESNIRFVGLNHSKTIKEILTEKANSNDPKKREAQMALQQMEEINDQRLFQKVKQNDVSKVDVDILIQEGPDVVTIQQEQFAALLDLAKIYGPDHVRFEDMVKLSGLRNKDQFIGQREMSQEERQLQEQQMQRQMLAQDLALKEQAGKVDKLEADTEQKRIETQVLLHTPIRSTNVAV